jgi:hypothetical protein
VRLAEVSGTAVIPNDSNGFAQTDWCQTGDLVTFVGSFVRVSGGANDGGIPTGTWTTYDSYMTTNSNHTMGWRVGIHNGSGEDLSVQVLAECWGAG